MPVSTFFFKQESVVKTSYEVITQTQPQALRTLGVLSGGYPSMSRISRWCFRILWSTFGYRGAKASKEGGLFPQCRGQQSECVA